MPNLTFTSGNDSFTVNVIDTFDLTFLAGDDTLQVIRGTVSATMGDGNDLVTLKGGTSTVFGESGVDRFDLFVAATVDGGADNDLFNVRGGTGLDAQGGDGDDRFNFITGAASVLLHGGVGDDDFFGQGQVVSGDIFGDGGDDFFVNFSNSTSSVILHGGAGNDIYRFHEGTLPFYVENVAEGTDSVQVARGVSFLLPANIENISVQGFSGSSLADGPSLVGNELANTINAHNNSDFIQGADGNDRLFGKGANDSLFGGAGDDFLDGGPDNDVLTGGDGNDTMNGRAGSDLMFGGSGDDVFFVDAETDTVDENAGEGTDLIRSSAQVLLPVNVENGILIAAARMIGNSGNNEITGSSGDDQIEGESGNDTIRGGLGGDILKGDDFNGDASGDDFVSGGGGNDFIFGGPGQDTLIGGAGTDSFSFFAVDSAPGTADHITDFTSTDGNGAEDDRLDLSFADANSTLAGNQAFTIVGAPTGVAGQLWFTADEPTEIVVHGDTNGDGVEDLLIFVTITGDAFFPDDIFL